MAFPLFLPDIVGLFLSGWNLRASSMYRLLTLFSVTISFMEKPNIPSESLRFTPTPSGSYPLSIVVSWGGGVNSFGYVVVGGGFFEGGGSILRVGGDSEAIDWGPLNEEIVTYA